MNDMLWTIVEILINLVEVACIQWYLHRKLGTGSHPHVRWITGGLLLWILSSTMTEVAFFSNNTLLRVCLLTIGCTIYAVVVAKGNIGMRIFNGIFIFITLGIIDTVVTGIYILFPEVNIDDIANQTMLRIQALIASKIIFIFMVYMMSRKKVDANLSALLWILLCSVPIINVLVMGAIVQYEVKLGLGNSPELLIASIGILFISILILLLFERFSNISQQNLHQKMMLQQAGLQRDYIREIEAANDQVRGFRHDYRNHIQVISGYLMHKRYQEIETYLGEISQFLDDTDIRIDTGNPTVDAVLGSKLTIARKQHIDVEYTVQMPEELSISPMDLSCLLGNLMDNALEACQRLQDPETDRAIDLTIDVHQGHLSIAISNTTDPIPDPQKYGLPVTHKGKGHGIGMSNIQRIVDSHHGMMKLRAERDTFFVLILLPLPSSAT